MLCARERMLRRTPYQKRSEQRERAQHAPCADACARTYRAATAACADAALLSVGDITSTMPRCRSRSPAPARIACRHAADGALRPRRDQTTFSDPMNR